MQWRTEPDPLAGDPWANLGLNDLPAPEIIEGVARRSGVVYSSAPGYRPLELDLYAPAAAWSEPAASHPTIIWIHGGAFAMGSKRLLPEFLQQADFFSHLAREGFVVVSIDYRLSSEAVWPAQLLDVRSAIRWLRARADELGVDPDAIAVWGESAGGHLAAMAGATGDREHPYERAGLPSPRVAAVVDWYGPSDFSAMDRQAGAASGMSHDDPVSPESRLLGAPVQDVPARVADANPAAQVGLEAPPYLIRHGIEDRLVPVGQSELLADALRAVGVPVDFAAVDGAGHVFEGHEDPRRFIDEAVAFLNRTLPARPKGQQ